MTQMVDWNLAVTTAGALVKSGPNVTYAEATDVVTELRRLVDAAEAHVQRYTCLTATVPHPPVNVVDRKDWVQVNVGGLQLVLNPLIDRLAAGSSGNAVTRL